MTKGLSYKAQVVFVARRELVMEIGVLPPCDRFGSMLIVVADAAGSSCRSISGARVAKCAGFRVSDR